MLRGELREEARYKDLRLIIIGDEIARHPALRHAVIQSRVEDSVRFLGFVPIETLRAFTKPRRPSCFLHSMKASACRRSRRWCAAARS